MSMHSQLGHYLSANLAKGDSTLPTWLGRSPSSYLTVQAGYMDSPHTRLAQQKRPYPTLPRQGMPTPATEQVHKEHWAISFLSTLTPTQQTNTPEKLRMQRLSTFTPTAKAARGPQHCQRSQKLQNLLVAVLHNMNHS